MKLTRAQIRHFNHPETLVVIGSFPRLGSIHDKNKDALASFTKNRVTGLQYKNSQKIIVFTHQEDTSIIEEEPNLLIIRCFQKYKPVSYLTIIKILKKFGLVRDILIEFEFSTFGDNLMTLAFIPFLAFLRAGNKHITVELHQVLTQIEDLRGHLGYKKHSLKARFFNPALISFYRLVGLLSDHVIVLEAHLKEHLAGIMPESKVQVVPHGVQTIKLAMTPSEAKKKLGFAPDDLVVLSFGYLTWYKGSDIFVKAAEELAPHKKIRFILAGGASHNQKHKAHYMKWYKKLLFLIRQVPGLRHTDFIEEKNISLHYQAADLVVFPYRAFMSSSGPLSLALSHKKPFIISRKLKPYLYSEDMKSSLNKTGLIKEDLLFSTFSASLAKRILYLSKHPDMLKKIKQLSRRLASLRSYEKLGSVQLSIVRRSAQTQSLHKTQQEAIYG